jgi:hypothetical protein
MENTYTKSFKSVWLDKNTYLLTKEWARWRKHPFKKPLLLKRALVVLIYCGGRYYHDHRQDPDLHYPDALQMRERFDKRSPFDFITRSRRLNYKLVWLDTESYFILKKTSRALRLPMKHALPIIVDWGAAYYSVKMIGSGAVATDLESKLQELIMARAFPKEWKILVKMFPPFLRG